eukprot:5868777-Prymnesium_polylepis.1
MAVISLVVIRPSTTHRLIVFTLACSASATAARCLHQTRQRRHVARMPMAGAARAGAARTGAARIRE